MAIFKNTQPIVTNGLILYLDAANPQSYISGSTTWNDLSISYNTTTVSASNFSNNSFIMTGSSNLYPTLQNTISFTTSSNWTINFIFSSNTTSSATDYFRLVATGSGNGDIQWIRLEHNNRLLAGGSIGTPGLFFSGFTPGCSLNRSYNDLVLTCTQGTASLYVNGVKTTYSSLQTNTINFNRLGLGNGTTNGGSLANVKVYNKELSQAEVTQNYNAMKSRFNLN